MLDYIKKKSVFKTKNDQKIMEMKKKKKSTEIYKIKYSTTGKKERNVLLKSNELVVIKNVRKYLTKEKKKQTTL